MRVAIFYNKEGRELENFIFLESLIKKAYPDAEILIIGLYAPAFWRAIFSFQPQVILAYPLTPRGISKYYYLLKALFNCKILLYRTEGAISKERDAIVFCLGHEEYGPMLVDGELFWGRMQRDAVAPLLLKSKKLSSLERAQVTGYLRYEILLQGPRTLPQAIATQISSHTKKEIIMFITGFHFADYTDEDMVKAGDLFDPSAANASEALASLCLARDKALVFRERWIKAIIETARLNPECLIIVKPHPVELDLWQCGVPNPYIPAFNSIANILFISEPSHTEELIAASSTLIHYGSTCLADTYLLNTSSIEATAKDLASDLPDKRYASFLYGALDWPSNATLPIQELPEFIAKNKALLAVRNPHPDEHRLLEDNFNMVLRQGYYPSKTIIDCIFNERTLPKQRIEDDILDLHFFYKKMMPMQRLILREGIKTFFHLLCNGKWKKAVALAVGGMRLCALMFKGFRVRNINTNSI